MSFEEYVYNQSPAAYSEKILVLDDDNLKTSRHIADEFEKNGFIIVEYADDLEFRLAYETDLKTAGVKMAIFANSNAYIPYDLLRLMTPYYVAIQQLFPEVETTVINSNKMVNLDLFTQAYTTSYLKKCNAQQTRDFIDNKVLSKDNIKQYAEKITQSILSKLEVANSPVEWFEIAELKAELDVLSAKFDLNLQTDMVNERFCDYCNKNFGTLSTKLNKETPIIVSRVMEYIHEHSEKYVIIVMDGMSEFDWNIISKSFKGIKYHKSSVMAIIPSTTSVSRQCLLGGKLPAQLENPWKQDCEKKEFIACAKELGFNDNQIGYDRGYEVQFGQLIKCGSIIIMDVDEIVHAQKQGRVGMLQDMELLTKQAKLLDLTKRMLQEGFDVYITADHGNTACIGMGQIKGAGVEVETKSRRFLVLKDFADKEKIKANYDLIEYPKYYLPKEFDYLICKLGKSFDVKKEEVMSHGGITIDEVVVPFIKIKAVENNG